MTTISPERATTLAELSRTEALLALARDSAAGDLDEGTRERLAERLEARRARLLTRLGDLSAIELPRHQLIEDLAALARDAAAGVGPEAERAPSPDTQTAAASEIARSVEEGRPEDQSAAAPEAPSLDDSGDLIKPVSATAEAEPIRHAPPTPDAAPPSDKVHAHDDEATVIQATREAVQAANEATASTGPIRVVLRPGRTDSDKSRDESADKRQKQDEAAEARNEAEAGAEATSAETPATDAPTAPSGSSKLDPRMRSARGDAEGGARAAFSPVRRPGPLGSHQVTDAGSESQTWAVTR